MAFYEKNIITCVEIGTSKICALHGTCDKAGNPVILGFGQTSPEGSVCKSDIVDYQTVTNALEKALGDADQSAGRDFERKSVYCVLNGPGIFSRQGEGNVVIYDADHKVKQSHIDEAVRKAQSLSLPPDQVHLNSFDSYFLLDTCRIKQNPLGSQASRLDAYLHIISAERNRVEMIRAILKELGFESDVSCVFSGVSSAYATLRADEKQQGVLLIDMGAGVTNYLLVQKDGILASGVLPVGTENVANDLAIGLEIGIEQARRFLNESRLEDYRASGAAFIELSGTVQNTKRRIPVGSFEKIIELRLREIFSIIREQIDSKGLTSKIETGVVFCGGGATMQSAVEALRGVMGMHVRKGETLGISGAMTGMEIPYRYTALLGLLKFAAEIENSSSTESGFRKVGDVLEEFGESFFKKVKDVTRGFKV